MAVRLRPLASSSIWRITGGVYAGSVADDSGFENSLITKYDQVNKVSAGLLISGKQLSDKYSIK